MALQLLPNSRTSEHRTQACTLISPGLLQLQTPIHFSKRIHEGQANNGVLRFPQDYPYPILSRKGQTKQAVQNAALAQDI